MSAPGDPRGTRRWKDLAALIIQRDKCCVVCGSEDNLQVDHIHPISKGGPVWEEDNLQTMCGYHNRQKSNNTTGQLTDYINPRWIRWEKQKQT